MAKVEGSSPFIRSFERQRLCGAPGAAKHAAPERPYSPRKGAPPPSPHQAPSVGT